MNNITLNLVTNNCNCVESGECTCSEDSCYCDCECINCTEVLISEEDMCACGGNGCSCGMQDSIEEDM